MKFLSPTSGKSTAYGVLTSPGSVSVITDIKDGKLWAADNQVFTNKFEPKKFFTWLEKHSKWKDTCLFVAVPDVVGDSKATLMEYNQWFPYFDNWPLAYVAQDGSEDLSFPENFDALFVGGSTEWKLSNAAISVIKRAQKLDKHIHVGRVNWWRRYRHFRLISGSEDFTCDGTRMRFDGKERTLRAWHGYESQLPLFGI